MLVRLFRANPSLKTIQKNLFRGQKANRKTNTMGEFAGGYQDASESSLMLINLVSNRYFERESGPDGADISTVQPSSHSCRNIFRL
jgi:hypothetical protein